MVRLCPARSCRADSLRTKPSAAIAASTRSRVVALTTSGRLRTLLTVPTETRACSATSRMLAASGSSSRASGGHRAVAGCGHLDRSL
jgi:hypothetical protein